MGKLMLYPFKLPGSIYGIVGIIVLIGVWWLWPIIPKGEICFNPKSEKQRVEAKKKAFLNHVKPPVHYHLIPRIWDNTPGEFSLR